MDTKPTKDGAHLAPQEGSNINKLVALSTDHLAPPKQYQLNIGVRVEKSVGGIEMGILENGMPYLNPNGPC